MGRYKLPEQLDSISSNIAALIFQTPRSQLSSGLAALGKLLFQVAKLDINLERPASAVWVDVKKSLFENVKKAIDLGLGVPRPFFLFA